MRKKLFPILSALAAAILYAVGIPLSKVLLRTTEPVYLAGFLYLGAGLGMLPLSRVTRRERAARLDRSDLPYTLGMIVLDIAAPILLLLGLRSTPAAAVSLIGNFEIVATALIALLLFHERISPLMWLSVLCLTAACLLLSLGGTERLSFSPASLLVLAACACWGLENNCTRKLSGKDAYEIVILKGIFSGLGSCATAFALGERFPAAGAIGAALLLGFFSYGLSIFFYARAQRDLGAARTSAYYSVNPFLGALLSFLLLKEALPHLYIPALLVMAIGAAFATLDALRLRHAHTHTHTVVHTHDGSTHTHTFEHSHPHTHFLNEEAHAHPHSGAHHAD